MRETEVILLHASRYHLITWELALSKYKIMNELETIQDVPKFSNLVILLPAAGGCWSAGHGGNSLKIPVLEGNAL